MQILHTNAHCGSVALVYATCHLTMSITARSTLPMPFSIRQSIITPRHLKLAGALACAVFALGGCAQLNYFVQAAHGQFSLLSEAKPIDEWLTNPATEDKLKTKLGAVRDIHRFAINELQLPDNGSYQTYADLKRQYVMWNVVATPEFSLEPVKWCFPIAGCVNYRGYYNKADAEAYAAELRREGYDVDVSGVPAYSTLGWFRDPVLSTFIGHPEAELARLIFHEMAHQVVYVAGDSSFNESFATAVEEVGIELWVARKGDEKLREGYAAYKHRKQDFLQLLLKHRHALKASYENKTSVEDKRREKSRIFSSLKSDYELLKSSWGGYRGYDRWFAEPLSNAHLSSVATYHDHVPAFRSMLARHNTLGQFYEAVRALSRLDQSERQVRLAAFGKTMSAEAHIDSRP